MDIKEDPILYKGKEKMNKEVLYCKLDKFECNQSITIDINDFPQFNDLYNELIGKDILDEAKENYNKAATKELSNDFFYIKASANQNNSNKILRYIRIIKYDPALEIEIRDNDRSSVCIHIYSSKQNICTAICLLDNNELSSLMKRLIEIKERVEKESDDFNKRQAKKIINSLFDSLEEYTPYYFTFIDNKIIYSENENLIKNNFIKEIHINPYYQFVMITVKDDVPFVDTIKETDFNKLNNHIDLLNIINKSSYKRGIIYDMKTKQIIAGYNGFKVIEI